MINRPAAVALMLAAAAGAQILLSVVHGELTVVNPYLALLVVLSVRFGRAGGILWGGFLGALTDVSILPVGYHAISMALIGYALAILGGRVIIRGPGPIAMLLLAAYPTDLLLVTLLHLLIGERVLLSLWWLLVPGGLFTAAIAMGLESFAQRFIPVQEHGPKDW